MELIDITPQILTKFTDEEARKIEQLGFGNSNTGAYPCMGRRDKYNYTATVYKTHCEYVVEIYDEQTFKTTQKIYHHFSNLLKFLGK